VIVEMMNALEKIIGYAVHTVQPERIILFGSLAHGRNNVHSDVDLLIVVEHPYRKNELEMQIRSLAKEYSLKADVLIRTPREIEQASLNPLSFLSSVIKDGKIVYEKGA
jgi:predicted nucleotidyltransferase